MKLHVGNLSFSSSEADLWKAFGVCGPVVSVNIVVSQETGNRRGFALVEMEDEGGAWEAIRSLDGTDLGGRNIRVHLVQGGRPNPPPAQLASAPQQAPAHQPAGQLRTGGTGTGD